MNRRINEKIFYWNFYNDSSIDCKCSRGRDYPRILFNGKTYYAYGRSSYIHINDGKQELKAMQVDKEIMNILGNSENPFYIYDSNNEKKIVRMGDYFILLQLYLVSTL